MPTSLKTLLKLLVREALLKDDERLGIVSGRTNMPTLRVFDFDDTLVKTNSKVGVIEINKDSGEESEKYYISPAAYAKFDEVKAQNPGKDYKFDYGQFAQVVEPKIIDFTFKILTTVVKKMREDAGVPAVILTARGTDANSNIRNFLRSFDIDIPVITLDSSNPASKAAWIKRAMINHELPHVEFFDDSNLNVRAVADLSNDLELIERYGKELKIKSRLIKAE